MSSDASRRDERSPQSKPDGLRLTDELADYVGRLAGVGAWDADLSTGRVACTAEIGRILELEEGRSPSVDDVRRFFPAGVFEVLQRGDPPGSNGTFDHELTLVTAKGRTLWVRVLGRREMSAGRAIRLLGALRDLTRQHDAELERTKLETQLQRARKMETLGMLAGGIAHDFNNQLTGILGYSELAVDFVGADHPARAYLAEILSAGTRARELVDQIVTYTREIAEASGAEDAEAMRESVPRGKGELVCVVDDEAIVGRFTRKSIEKLGYRAVAFASAEDCLASWQKTSAAYRVLVTDQAMPGLKGTELAAALQKSIPGLAVVIVSDYSAKISAQELEGLRYVEQLAKPLTSGPLDDALQRALQASVGPRL